MNPKLWKKIPFLKKKAPARKFQVRAHKGSHQFFITHKSNKMARYYVNKHRDHEVHKEACARMPSPENRICLGDYTHCKPAVEKARQVYRIADGCYYCCEECHSG